jgi:hypothetical protein
MITRNDFRQNRLIERIDEILHPKVRARLDADWAGIFRNVFLRMMPVDDIGQGFSRNFGRPTREHYSICGLLLLKDYFGWTVEESVKHYLYDLEIHYALRIEPDCLEMSTRTLERYLKIFRKNELAQKLMDTVTRKIIADLNIKVDKQRLDSTHIFSNMADLTRSMLMFRTVKRFLIQVKRHESKLYHELDAELRKLYDGSGKWVYDKEIATRNVRYRGKTYTNKEQVMWDAMKIIERFENHQKLSKINTFKDLVRVFNEQCEMVDGNLQRRKHPGGEALVNTSDPDAGVDNKGVGYQAQVSQTHNPENPVQVITAVIPQSASEADQNAVEPMLEKMKKNNAMPEECSADTAYGSDENVLRAAEQGVELLAPASGKEKGSLGLEECEFDQNNRLVKCPLGKKPLKSTFKDGKGRAVFACNVCGKCPEYKRCCASKSGNNYVITYDARGLRLRERRLYEQSEEFYERHRFRGGIEALFGNLKQNTPLRRLAVRGKEAVFSAIHSIMAVHNIMQAAKVYANQEETVPKKMVQAAKSFVSAMRTDIAGVWLAFPAPRAA